MQRRRAECRKSEERGNGGKETQVGRVRAGVEGRKRVCGERRGEDFLSSRTFWFLVWHTATQLALHLQ